jgi:hypothetical protein
MPASGHQDHTTSPSATVSTKATRRSWYQSRRSFSEGGSAPLVSRHPASTASRPASVTIAKRPYCRGGTGRTGKDDLPDGQSGLFFADGVDRGATQRGVIYPIRKRGKVFVTMGRASPYKLANRRPAFSEVAGYGFASNPAYGPENQVLQTCIHLDTSGVHEHIYSFI